LSKKLKYCLWDLFSRFKTQESKKIHLKIIPHVWCQTFNRNFSDSRSRLIIFWSTFSNSFNWSFSRTQEQLFKEWWWNYASVTRLQLLIRSFLITDDRTMVKCNNIKRKGDEVVLKEALLPLSFAANNDYSVVALHLHTKLTNWKKTLPRITIVN
jgi:hypothetical protein